jgi:hypothetical protein
MASERETSKGDVDAIVVARVDSSSDLALGHDGEKAEEVLCFSTGPTSGMAFRYVPAVLQSGANVLGHIPGTNKPCAKRGVIRCVVPFGTGEVDYNSYM